MVEARQLVEARAVAQLDVRRLLVGQRLDELPLEARARQEVLDSAAEEGVGVQLGAAWTISAFA